MHKNIKIVLAFILAIALTTPLNVRAEETVNEVTVNNYGELKTAAADTTITKITLGADIEVEEPILFLHNVTVDGAQHTLSAQKTKDALTWESLYILKFHRVDATVMNIKFDGGDAAIQVNNSTLGLVGNITLGNQAFGGIELTQGNTTNPDEVVLSTLNATITHETEVKGIPTIWTNKVQEETFADERFIMRDDIKANQKHYYLTDPDTVTVKSEAEFRQALADKATTIVLANDIDVASKIDISYPVTIDGKGFTLKGQDTEGWSGFYLLHFYKTSGTVKDIKLTGADAGLYANGSKVTLLGTIDVSGNEFGGIEVSQGKNVVEVPTLDATAATLVNDTEDFALPTVWNDGTEGEVLMNALFIRTDVKEGQTQYYIHQVTRTEKKVTDFVLDVLEKIELENFEVIVDREGRVITLRKVTEGAVLTEDEVVDALVTAIFGHENVERFTVNDRTYHEYDEATVDAAVREFIELVKANSEDATNVFNDLKLVLNFGIQYDGKVVPTEDLDVTLTETDKEDPADPDETEDPTDSNETEDPTEKPTDQGGDNDKKEDGKKTPTTGLSDLTTMYASLIVMGALVIVLTKLRKSHNV